MLSRLAVERQIERDAVALVDHQSGEAHSMRMSGGRDEDNEQREPAHQGVAP